MDSECVSNFDFPQVGRLLCREGEAQSGHEFNTASRLSCLFLSRSLFRLLVLSFHLEVGVTNVTFPWRFGTRLSLVMRAASPRHEFDLTTTQPISRVTI